jgi:hypothetical protein
MFPTRYRWFRFSLRSLFVIVTLLAVCVAWPLRHVNRRRAERTWIEQHGGSVDVFLRPKPIEDGSGLYIESYQRVMGPEVEPEIPRWRRWLGDESYNQIYMPQGTSQADLDRARAIFPEARVDVAPNPAAGSGFF